MLQLLNRTRLPAQLLALRDPDGVEALHVVVKATFALTPEAPLTEAQRPVVLADETVGEGPGAWLRVPSEAHPAKPATDVLVEGEAVAPRGRAVPELDVVVAVGALRREVRVIGDRRYTGLVAPFCTDPEPFARMPLTPDRAFGGTFTPTQLTEPRNPAGVGLVPSDLRDLRVIRGAPLPNLEDPDARLGRPGDRPPPALLTPVAASWSPRRERAGTYDEVWDRTRAPFLPTDFDPRFLQVAQEASWVRERLEGGEPIELRHLADAPTVRSRVPWLGLRVRARFRGAVTELPAHVETLVLAPGAGVGTLVLRATLRSGHRTLDVAAVEITEGHAR